jgi:hypothetical protein
LHSLFKQLGAGFFRPVVAQFPDYSSSFTTGGFIRVGGNFRWPRIFGWRRHNSGLVVSVDSLTYSVQFDCATANYSHSFSSVCKHLQLFTPLRLSIKPAIGETGKNLSKTSIFSKLRERDSPIVGGPIGTGCPARAGWRLLCAQANKRHPIPLNRHKIRVNTGLIALGPQPA